MNVKKTEWESEVTEAASFKAKKDFFSKGETRIYSFRIEQLKRLKNAIQSMETEIFSALDSDLHKPDFEAYVSEIGLVYDEIDLAVKKLKKWMKPEKVKTPLIHFPSKSRIYREPLGTVLIIGPWNYPFQLLITPLVGAIAAGNCAVIKPSEETPATASLIEKIIGKAFDRDFVSAVQGIGSRVVPFLMDQYRFDHIFFTGSVPVGKVIALGAAEKYTGCTLELGGKSPAVVDKSANIQIAAKRLMWAKFFNGGQTCVAPDYIIVHEDVKDEFTALAEKAISDFFGPEPMKSENLTYMVNEKRLETLISYLDQGKVITGGSFDRDKLIMEPTIMTDVSLDSPLMKEEIFGPVLPVLSYRENGDALRIIEKNPYPLAAYFYTENRETEKFFRDQVSFGGGCINNSLIHLSNPHLPFGGVAYSGSGSYHGEYSFNTFSHFKSIVKTSFRFDLTLKYAPYRKSTLSFLRKIL